MSLVHHDEWLDIHQGDCRDVMASLPEQSVQAVITSPPYWGLRDYGLPPSVWGGDPDHEHVWATEDGYSGHRGNRGQVPQTKWQANQTYPQATRHQTQGATSIRQGRSNVEEQRSDTLRKTQGECECGAWLGCLGLEPRPEMYVAHIVEVMEYVWLVLRDDGLLWLNLGDTYWSAGGAGGTLSASGAVRGTKGQVPRLEASNPELFGRWNRKSDHNIKVKDLVGIPWMTAFALRDAGWYLRRDNIWAKDNSMPESVDDRPTSSHEYVFTFAKSGRPTYWTHRDGRGSRVEPEPDWIWRRIDDPTVERSEALLPADGKEWRRVNLWESHDYHYDYAAALEPLSYPDAVGAPFGGKKLNGATTYSGREYDAGALEGRRKRSVWRVNTIPYPGAHYAVFPPELVRPMVRLSAPAETCPQCAAPYARRLEKTGPRPDRGAASGIAPENHAAGTRMEDPTGGGGNYLASVPTRTIGWQPTCAHEQDHSVPSTVLDPFAGSGTLGLVAQQERRRAILIDLNGDYLRQQMARATREFGVGGTYAREGQPVPEHPPGSLWEAP